MPERKHTGNDPVFVLADPQMGENIGAVARAMMNCGLIHLRLVRPRDGWPNERADAMAAGAFEKMPPVPVFDTVQEAVADCHFVLATTARPRDMNKPVFTARAAAAQSHVMQHAGQRTAFLFGAERAGLTNDDVALTHGIITIPVNPDFSSLNLGQAALLVAYEWYQAQDATEPYQTHDSENPPAPQEKFEELITRLESELEAHRFFRNPDQRPSMVRNLRNMMIRARMSEQEVRTFHGIISALTGQKN